jgi:hypothetical protein
VRLDLPEERIDEFAELSARFEEITPATYAKGARTAGSR